MSEKQKLKPCHCGFEGELAGMQHGGVYYSLTCGECNRSVTAFTLHGLIDVWNRPAKEQQQ